MEKNTKMWEKCFTIFIEYFWGMSSVGGCRTPQISIDLPKNDQLANYLIVI